MSQYGSFIHAESYDGSVYQGESGLAAKNWDFSIPSHTAYHLSTDSRTGKSNPSYKRQIAQCSNATTPFSGVKQEFTSSPSDFWVKGRTSFSISDSNWRAYRKRWNHDITTVPALPSSNLTDLATGKAQTEFYKRLESVTSLFQGGVFLGELRETLRMIRSPAKGLRRKIGDYLNDAKKRRRGSPSSKSKVLADLYLEHAFGWLPLLNDLDAARKYHTRRIKQLEREVVPIQGSHQVSTSSFSVASDVSGTLSVRAINRLVQTASVRYRGAVVSTALGTTVMSMSSMGLAPRSFIPTLWELLPWSFVIDYFTNIGDVISAWSNQRVKLAWGCETIRRESVLTSTSSTGTPSGLLVIVTVNAGTAGSTIARHKAVGRTSISYVPIPSIDFEIPGFGKKWLNLAALGVARRSMTPY